MKAKKPTSLCKALEDIGAKAELRGKTLEIKEDVEVVYANGGTFLKTRKGSINLIQFGARIISEKDNEVIITFERP